MQAVIDTLDPMSSFAAISNGVLRHQQEYEESGSGPPLEVGFLIQCDSQDCA